MKLSNRKHDGGGKKLMNDNYGKLIKKERKRNEEVVLEQKGRGRDLGRRGGCMTNQWRAGDSDDKEDK